MMSYHCEVERADRIAHIIAEIGMGQVIKEAFIHQRWTCITDTGITIIKSADKLDTITIYVTTVHELVKVYGGDKKIPPFLRKKVYKNESKYTINGKTIWA